MTRRVIHSDTRPGWTLEIFDSFAEADQADREYWLSRTPLQRMESLERIRGLAWGYDPDAKSRPEFQRIVEIVELRRR
jgi:hypothetical protein